MVQGEDALRLEVYDKDLASADDLLSTFLLPAAAVHAINAGQLLGQTELEASSCTEAEASRRRTTAAETAECWQQQVVDRAEAKAEFEAADVDGSTTLEPEEVALLVLELTGQKLKGRPLNRAVLDILGFAPDHPDAPDPAAAHIDFDRFFDWFLRAGMATRTGRKTAAWAESILTSPTK